MKKRFTKPIESETKGKDFTKMIEHFFETRNTLKKQNRTTTGILELNGRGELDVGEINRCGWYVGRGRVGPQSAQ